LRRNDGPCRPLIKNINDVLTFLAPEMRLLLELVRYETHAFPDVGQPQEVINRQIPLDYNVLIGAMWRHCGTPTTQYASGTIEEFWRAYEHGAKCGSPVIMLYFCDQTIPIPDAAELEQLEGVVELREKVKPLGYTVSYPTHEDFREIVRPGLLRAIRSLLQADPTRVSPEGTIALEAAPVDAGLRQQYLLLASEYNQLRERMAAGPERSRHMSAVFSRMLSEAGGVGSLLNELQNSPDPGQRLGAIAILHTFPSADHLDWLAKL
jgi:hypothetical protein